VGPDGLRNLRKVAVENCGFEQEHFLILKKANQELKNEEVCKCNFGQKPKNKFLVKIEFFW